MIMKRFFARFECWSLLFIWVILFSVLTTFAQTKLERANEIYHEAESLGEENSLESQRKALEKFQTAANLFKEISNKTGEAKTLLQIGTIYFTLGESTNAKKNAAEALKLSQQSGEQFWEAKSFNLLGLIYGNLGNFNDARIFFENSLIVFKKIDDFDEAIPVINNIGKVYEKIGDYKQALEFYNLPLAYLEQIKNEEAIALTLDNIGGLYFCTGEYRKSLEAGEKSLAIHRKLGNKSREGNALNNVGAVYLKLGNAPKAIELINRSLPILRSVGNSRTEAVALTNLMAAWKNSNNRETAMFYGKQAVNSYQELRRAAEGLDTQTQKSYLNTISETYRFLADLLIESGKFAQAEQVLRMLKEEEYFDFVQRDAGEIKSLNQRVKLTEKEQELIKRYTILADKIVQIGEDFQKLDIKKRELSRTNDPLSAEDQVKYETLSAQLADANSAFRLFLDKQLSEELGKSVTKTIEFDRNLQSKLTKWEKGTVILHTVAAENRYRVILTTPTVQIDGKTEIKLADLNKKIFAFREVLQDHAVDPRLIGKELYDILIKPIEKDLQAAGAKTLIWSLDGTLRYIPLAALSPDGKTYLAENFQNVILTAKTTDDLSDTNEEWRALGVGVSEELSVIDPENKSEKINFTALPAAKNELMKIIRDENSPSENGILAGRRFLDKEFTLKSFSDSLAQETADGKRKFSVVHLASHFRLGNDWSSSFLLLGDGKILTLEEISSSPQINFGDVELITLSACNTAFADDSNGKEIDSLAEAIQTKSGKAVLATLWSVSDESTALLMSEFYRLRKENPNLTKSKALQTAQKSLINGTLKLSADKAKLLKPNIEFSENKTNSPAFQFDENKPFAHPFYWSPFVLIGNWR